MTLGFLGLVPGIPGTMGTLGGCAIVLLLPAGPWYPAWAAAAAAALAAAGWPLVAWAEARYGRKDPPVFVLDEAAGILAASLPAKPGWTALALLFCLFRFFDVWKPYPARPLEGLPRGAGIFLDDLVAGAYACILVGIVQSFFPEI